jgi:hypothetical protein
MKKLLLLLLFVSGAFALNIDSPTAKTYTGDVSLDISHPQKLNRIIYIIDGIEKGSCSNCSELHGTLSISAGSHILLAYGYSGSDIYSDRVDFSTSVADINLRIDSPLDKAYTTKTIRLDFATDVLSNITYKIDGNAHTACTNCKSFSDDVTLSYGTHGLEVKAKRGAVTDTESMEFTIKRTTIGLDVVSPKEKEYSDRDIVLEFATAEKADITYEIDGNDYNACTDCETFEKTVRLAEGDHTLNVRAKIGSDYETETVDFSINEDSTGINLDVVSPVDKEYNDRDIALHFTTDEKSDITYKIDGKEYNACTDCTNFARTVRLAEGDHTIDVRAESGSDVDTASVEFTIDESATDNGLQIVSPEAKDYSSQDISIDIRADKNDISYWIDGKKEDSCTSCTRLTDDVTLSTGWHTLLATAGSDSETVRFRVIDDSSLDYGTGFEKLPQLLESGDITDAELAKILRENRMPPGIVNRLIKTGKLGDQAIDAILSYQFNPPGIMKRFWGYFGWRQMGYADEIYDRYTLNDTHWEKMLQRDDLAKDKANAIKGKLSQKIKMGKGNYGKSWKGGHED